MKKADQLRGMNPDELESMVEELRAQRFSLENELAEMGKCKHPHRIPQVKQEIARVLTVLAEKRKVS